MELSAYESGIESDCQTVGAIDWRNFDQKVRDRPEDYVFILSPDEWNKFMELDQQIRVLAASKGKDNRIKATEYISQYQGVFMIAALGTQPGFLRRYKIGSFTNRILGTSRAVLYIDRSTNDMDRANAVLRRIKDYKTNVSKEHYNGN